MSSKKVLGIFVLYVVFVMLGLRLVFWTDL